MGKPFYTNSDRKTLGHVVKHEADYAMSRETVTVLAGSGSQRKLTVGMIAAAVLVGAITITPDGGNTGDGALGAATLGPKAKAGDYVITCISAVTNGGVFRVVDPDGDALPVALVGVAYTSPQLNFTISDGAADWAVGDEITVTVAAGSGKIVQLDPTATDGSQRVRGIVAADVTAADGTDAVGQLINSDAVAAEGELVWPDDITTDQKNAALAELAALNIQVRTSA